MPRVKASSDNKLFDVLILLKRHLNECAACRAARKCNDPYMMCSSGIEMVMATMTYYDTIIALRIQAKASTEQHIYPCPSLRAHGKTYELTALPVMTVGVQDRLF